MRPLSILFSIIIFLAVSAYADAKIWEFSAEPFRDKTILRWKTEPEKDIHLFILERSTNNKNFNQIAQLPPNKKKDRYQYSDENLNNLKTLYYYRLRIINDDGNFQISESIIVTPKISSLIKTWRTIKVLFQ